MPAMPNETSAVLPFQVLEGRVHHPPAGDQTSFGSAQQVSEDFKARRSGRETDKGSALLLRELVLSLSVCHSISELLCTLYYWTTRHDLGNIAVASQLVSLASLQRCCLPSNYWARSMPT